MRVLLPVFLIGFLAIGAGQASQTQTSQVGVVSGTVVDLSGSPVPGATVELRLGTLVERRAATNVRGEFLFEKVPFNSYDLHVVKPGFLAASSPAIVKSSTPLALRLMLVARHAGGAPASRPGARS